ncbi:MAG: hypothetical protein IKO14_04420 [Oscillibacter sp.]|nr:hypothetical protein [Oscillibacter sp.]
MQDSAKGSRLREPGKTDEWVLEEELGRGGAGAVYSAVRADGAEASAIKVVTSFLNHDGDLEKLAENERRAERIESVLKKWKIFLIL